MSWQEIRLMKEWELHGKLIIACDFDDTLKPFSLTDPYSMNRMEVTMQTLRECSEIGAHIILFTASDKSRYAEMTEFCEAHDLTISGINTNLPGLRYGNDTKVYANIYLDDRAGIEESIQVLRNVVNIMKTKKR